MPTGRKTGGRAKGTPNKRTLGRKAAIAKVSGASPLDIMLGAARAAWQSAQNEDGKIDVKKAVIAASIAKDAAPYLHPKLSSIEHTGKGGKDLIPKAGPDQLARRLAFLLTKGAAEAGKDGA